MGKKLGTVEFGSLKPLSVTTSEKSSNHCSQNSARNGNILKSFSICIPFQTSLSTFLFLRFKLVCYPIPI